MSYREASETDNMRASDVDERGLGALTVSCELCGEEVVWRNNWPGGPSRLRLLLTTRFANHRHNVTPCQKPVALRKEEAKKQGSADTIVLYHLPSDMSTEFAWYLHLIPSTAGPSDWFIFRAVGSNTPFKQAHQSIASVSPIPKPQQLTLARNIPPLLCHQSKQTFARYRLASSHSHPHSSGLIVISMTSLPLFSCQATVLLPR